uniref:Uncharacterized protein n=1 Tax=Anguilla anguilla TaxID=7936 RepID=A0A0E9WB19_ANGAN
MSSLFLQVLSVSSDTLHQTRIKHLIIVANVS